MHSGHRMHPQRCAHLFGPQGLIDFIRHTFQPKIISHRVGRSQFSSEGLVQQRLLQRLQRGVLPLVEAGEALGFFR